jgi:hypothetical protein
MSEITWAKDIVDRREQRLPPPIIAGRFEQHGKTLATYERPNEGADQ